VSVPDLNFELVSDASASRLGRAALVPLEVHLPPETYADLNVIVSELTANAVKHGPGTPIGVSVEIRDDGSIRGQVDDGGSGGFAIAHGDPFAGPGLGLKIVDTLTSAWGLDPGTTRVWFELAPLPPTRTEAPGPAP
jgi:anti-sigma regulatory factor (Ser/Thr protein kinase)